MHGVEIRSVETTFKTLALMLPRGRAVGVETASDGADNGTALLRSTLGGILTVQVIGRSRLVGWELEVVCELEIRSTIAPLCILYLSFPAISSWCLRSLSVSS